jgi:DNA-directed RNA polymerase specialized sigma24 family protein
MALERALAELTQHQRDVFLLYEVEGFNQTKVQKSAESKN